ncbi:4-coumarate--CoA ligase family protein [Solihabitans fulvus]|uniref:4-coumarate--CoA ligase family protein n=1 Tax=Solihabitans fulvus TaxID=1892852 RepID=A0A5B2WIJ5_9PSEU|nr:AMP-binding protein [Solihabitans fulvus]KAA2251225.1 4-coumarate--CoA ligase family protein [Solihabitans fulvus]
MIHTSPLPDIELPRSELSEFVLADAETRGEHPALVDGTTGRVIDYATLRGLVDRVARALAGAGLRAGDVVAVYAPNTVLYPVACYAASRAGATVTTVNALYTPGELIGQLADSGASLLVTISHFLPALASVDLPAGLREVLVLDQAPGYRSLLDLPADPDQPLPTVDPAEDIALLPYSSGTTGTAKGVRLTHSNLTAAIAQMVSAMPIGPEHRVLAVLPFSHVYGFATMMGMGLRAGATIVVLPRFDLEQFLRTIAEQRITVALIAPPIALALAKHPLVDQYDLSSLWRVLSAASPLDPDISALVHRRIGVPVVQAYGMTESSSGCHVPPGETVPPAGSVGVLLPQTECRLVSTATGADVGVGEVGELVVRGPQVMKGYLNRPEETAATLDAEGWLRTGDIGRVDADGWFYIVDRVKELIKYKGYQVAPAELEAVLVGHPQIADAAVVGVPGADGEEVPKAFVVRQPGADGLDDRQVMDFVAERVAPYKKVRAVEFIQTVPRSIAGKILRRELRDAATA